MKVVLLQDVKSLGKAGDLVEVTPGYARNMLLPKKLGVEATPKTLNDLKLKKAHEEKLAAAALAQAKEMAEKLAAGMLTVKIKVGENNRVFGSVSTKEIAEAAKEQLGIELDKKKLVLPAPIKELGETTVGVKLHPSVTGELKIRVEAE